MKAYCRTALAEAAMILLTASILGFMYTGITGKGFFRRSQVPEGDAGQKAVASAFITFDEAQRLYRQGSALFVDARYSGDFSVGHVKGAISLPLQQFDNNHPVLAYIPRDKLVVTYCDGAECNSSAELAVKLRAVGYSNVKIFFGGWSDWLAHKQPTEP